MPRSWPEGRKPLKTKDLRRGWHLPRQVAPPKAPPKQHLPRQIYEEGGTSQGRKGSLGYDPVSIPFSVLRLPGMSAPAQVLCLQQLCNFRDVSLADIRSLPCLRTINRAGKSQDFT